MAVQALKKNSDVTVDENGILVLNDQKFRSCNRFLQDLKDTHGIVLVLRDKESSLLMRCVGKFFVKTRLSPRFMSHFFTIIGNTIYVPLQIIEQLGDARLLQVLMHETIHAFDRKKYGTALFSAAYLFPQILALFAPVGALVALLTWSSMWLWMLVSLLFLAPLPAPFRMWFEVRAHRADVAFAKKVTYNNRTGEELPENYIALLSNHYCNGEYYFMWPFRKHVMKLLTIKPSNSDKAYLFVTKWTIVHKATTGRDVSVSFFQQ